MLTIESIIAPKSYNDLVRALDACTNSFYRYSGVSKEHDEHNLAYLLDVAVELNSRSQGIPKRKFQALAIEVKRYTHGNIETRIDNYLTEKSVSKQLNPNHLEVVIMFVTCFKGSARFLHAMYSKYAAGCLKDPASPEIALDVFVQRIKKLYEISDKHFSTTHNYNLFSLTPYIEYYIKRNQVESIEDVPVRLWLELNGF